MTSGETYLAVCLSITLFTMVLWVFFGQLTVRRLRKHPETKDLLGTEFYSGWDILNVAGALSRPKWFSEMMRKSPLSFMAADERPIYANTNKFERCVARLFFLSAACAFFTMMTFLLLSVLGVLD